MYRYFFKTPISAHYNIRQEGQSWNSPDYRLTAEEFGRTMRRLRGTLEFEDDVSRFAREYSEMITDQGTYLLQLIHEAHLSDNVLHIISAVTSETSLGDYEMQEVLQTMCKQFSGILGDIFRAELTFQIPMQIYRTKKTVTVAPYFNDIKPENIALLTSYNMAEGEEEES